MALSLVERLAERTDPRSRQGRQYPMVGLLTLCLVAVLAGHTGPEAIAQFGRLRQKRLGHALGFRNGKRPCANTIAALLRNLDADYLDRIIAAWLTGTAGGSTSPSTASAGGSRDGGLPGTHLPAAYVPHASAVIAQMTVEATTNKHKATLRLLGGAVVTADALFIHADVRAAVQQKQGDDILYAKDNQAALRDDLEATFAAADRGAFSPLAAGAVG